MSTASVSRGDSLAKGNAEWLPSKQGGGRYVARISLGGKRTRIEMKGADGNPQFIDKVRHRKAAQKCAAEISAGFRQTNLAAVPTGAKITVKEFGQQWTSGELFRKHGEVRGLKIKKSAKDDRNRLALHVYPYIGDKPIADVSEEDVERAFARAFAAAVKRNGKPLDPSTRRHVYMVSHRLFELAIRPGRLRTTNPVTDDLLPARGKTKLYSYLYPSELLALLRCTEIPIERRVYYALGTYTGLRKSSLRAFTWTCVDLEHRTIISLVNKNDVPQMFAQADEHLPGLASLIELLRRYRELCGWPEDSAPIVAKLRAKKDAEAETLRMDLDCAGVTREILFTKSEQIVPLRFHDLRATFVTWARRAGKGDGWISDRTGHITKKIMERYNRAARSLADLKIDPFPDIAEAIPELAAVVNVARLPKRRR